MANRWRLGFAAAALAWLAVFTVPLLIAPAQAQAPDINCRECAEERLAIAYKELELASLQLQLQQAVDGAAKITSAVLDNKGQATVPQRDQLSNLNEQRKQLEPKISAARDAIVKLKDALTACAIKHCGPASKANAQAAKTTTHTYPESACPRCDELAEEARKALGGVLEVEAHVAGSRYEIFELKAWLAQHAAEQSTALYKDKAEQLRPAENALKYWEGVRVAGQRYLDELMEKLLECNVIALADLSRECYPRTSPSITSTLGLSEEVPKANCPECEGAALKFEADLAKLRVERIHRMRDIAEINALNDKLSGGTKAHTKAEAQAEEQAIQAAIKDAQSRLQQDEKSIAESEQAVANDRVALDACNKAHPSTSCQPPTGTSTAPGPGTAGGTGGATGQQKTGDGTNQPVIRGQPTGPADKGGPNGKTPQTPPSKKPAPQAPSGGTGMVPGAPGSSSLAMVNAGTGTTQYDLNLANSYSLLCRSAEGPPKAHRTRDIFDFDVPRDALLDVLDQPFVIEPHFFLLPDGKGYSVSSGGGANPSATWSALQGFLSNGTIANLGKGPCVGMQPESGLAAGAGSCALGTDGLPAGAVHVVGSFGATLLGSDGQPVPGAYVIYGPPSPTPFFNPGERPGDDQPPTIVRTGSDGTYRAQLGTLTGPIEIGVAKGCDAYTTGAIVDGPSAPAAGGATTETGTPLAILRNGTPAAAPAAGRPRSKRVIPRDATP